MDYLCEMINNGDLTFEDYLKIHPFSVSSKKIYKTALRGIDFFSEFYVKSVDTYIRLAEISNVVSTGMRNLVIITGYRGCGKTNFLRYVKHIARGGKIDKTLDQIKDFELANERSEERKKEILEHYSEAKEKIFNILGGRVDDVEGSELINYIQKSINGTTTYINFDVGGYQKNKPLSVKLFLITEDQLKEALNNNKLTKIENIIDSFIRRNRNSIMANFEDADATELEEFWKNMKVALDSVRQDEKNTLGILKLLRSLSLEHLLFAYFMWELAWLLVNMESLEKKQLYLLDNIDMLSDKEGKSFRSIIYGIFKYIYDSHNLFADIADKSKNDDDLKICKYYEQMNLIIAMRETSAMKVTDHYRMIVRQNMRTFDISEDLNKTLIIKLRVEFANNLIQSGKITNRYFINKTENLDSILKDEILMQRLFMLNNEDVRTSGQLFSKLCEKDLYSRSRKVYGSDVKGYVFGMRGIVYKDIFRIFDKSNYFHDLKIANYTDVKTTREYPFSYARVLLVLLYKQRKKQSDRILFNDAEYIELHTLYDEIRNVIPLDDFVEILDRMYSFRDEEYWNHLVTFDNVATYSREDILKYMQKERHEDEKKIHVCITSAGKMFLDQVCVHFEYFSQRFCSTVNKALFEYNSFKEMEAAEDVKSIIATVFTAVQQCLATLEEYNKAVLVKLNKKRYSEIISTSYYYVGQFHEERIILNHIQYLNAYRRYMINKAGNNKAMNQYLVKYINKYLDLLYSDDKSKKAFRNSFISDKSKKTYNRLKVCIEHIISSDYENLNIDITSDYYYRNYKDQRCRFFIEKGY